MTEREQQTADSATAHKIIATFERFSEAYDRYVDEMDNLVGSLEYDTPLQRKARCLILGLDDVSIFMRDARDVVKWNVWPFAKK
ncbi:MAG: hypothetical protein ACRECW_19425 [Phyllobacterium sp.]